MASLVYLAYAVLPAIGIALLLGQWALIDRLREDVWDLQQEVDFLLRQDIRRERQIDRLAASDDGDWWKR